MWRIFAIVVFLAVILPVDGQEKRSQSDSNQNHTYHAEKPSQSPRTATCVVEENGATIKCNWAEDQPESYFKRLASPENTPNIGLFFVGVGGIAAAFFTLLTIMKQTKETAKAANAAEKAAEAARLNAQAVINAERPWITISISCDGKNIEFYGRNQGRTPASILRFSFHHIVVSDPQDMTVPPAYSDKPSGEFLIAGGEPMLIARRMLTGSMACIADDDWKQIRAMERQLYFFGRVVYADVLTRDDKGEPSIRETRWCFMYFLHPDGESRAIHPSGPPEYRSYT